MLRGGSLRKKILGKRQINNAIVSDWRFNQSAAIPNPIVRSPEKVGLAEYHVPKHLLTEAPYIHRHNIPHLHL
jgi:hypothetical protein